MERGQLDSRIMPVAGIVYVIVMFLVDWNDTAVVVGVLLLGLIAVLGNRFAPR